MRSIDLLQAKLEELRAEATKNRTDADEHDRLSKSARAKAAALDSAADAMAADIERLSTATPAVAERATRKARGG